MRKDFVAKWGFTFKEIQLMDRSKFCNIHGDRFMGMDYYVFSKTIQKETPKLDPPNDQKWENDRLVNKMEHESCQLGNWDYVSEFI